MASFPMRSALVGNANMAIRREAFDRFGYFRYRASAAEPESAPARNLIFS